MTIEFYVMLRWQEVSSLRWSDLSFNAQGMKIRIRSSKTDQLGEGQDVDVCRQVGKGLDCPVALTQQFGRKLGFAAGKDGFLQPRMDPAKKGRTETKISYDTATKDLRCVLELAGVPAQGFTEHSGRRGGATALANERISLGPLMEQGRWRSMSSAQKYIDKRARLRNEAAEALAAAGTRATLGGAAAAAALDPADT